MPLASRVLTSRSQPGAFWWRAQPSQLGTDLKIGGNLLLLDEPTNDLDVRNFVESGERSLDFPGCAVITSHDRWFLDRVATHILAYEGDSPVVLV